MILINNKLTNLIFIDVMKKQTLKSLSVALMLLCTSVASFAAVDWSKYDFVGDGAGGGKYTNKYKVETVDGLSVVNIQKPGFADEAGIYMTVGGGISECSVASAIQGAGLVVYLSALTAQETEVTIKYAPANEITFHIYYADGAAAKKENVLLDEQTFASSGTASLANDGNNGTRWESASSDDQWWLCKMAEENEFNTVQILWEGAYAKSFKLEVSNDSAAWTEIAKIEDQQLAGFPYLQTIAVGDQKAKYLRFVGIARGTNYGYSFWELRAFTKKEQTLTAIELKAAADLVKVGESLALTTTTKDQDGEAMEAEVTYTVSPADAGTIENGAFKAAKFGTVTITATAGGVVSNSVSVFCYEGDNVALSTNLDNDNKVIAQSEIGNGTNAFFAVDGNEGSVWQGSATNGTADTEEARTYDSWFTLDLGAYYNINLVTIKFEGACSEAYHLDVSANNTDWNLAYNYVGAAGVNGHTDMLYGDNLANAQSVRYVRFWSTKAATSYGMKIYEMKVFATPGTAPADNEKPVMGTASLVSNTYNQAVVAVTATDNIGIASYHVVDAANAFDAKFTATEGNITITGLKTATTYNFTITAIDLTGNESDNAAHVQVVTPQFYPAPNVAAPVPAHDAENVLSIYSDKYDRAFATMESYNQGWWENPSMEEKDIEGDHFLRYFGKMTGMVGWQFAAFDATGMTHLHVDIWASADGTIQMGPTYGGDGLTTQVGICVLNVEKEKWNSFDIVLANVKDNAGTVLALSSIFQNQFTNYAAQTEFSVDNVYFWKEGTSTLLDATLSPANVQKLIENGQLIIIRDGIRYNAQGQVMDK